MHSAMLSNLLSTEAMADNIVRMIGRDPALAEYERGWYGRVERMITRLARCTGRDRFFIASLLAVLSPSVDWRDNWRMAIALLRDADAESFVQSNGKVALMQGYGANIRKARMMLDTGDTSYCRGPKVTRFRDAMLGLLEDDAVIDVHATNIALGVVNEYSGPANQAVYDALVDAYRLAASILGWHTCEVQSASWVVYKSTKPKRTREGQLMLDMWQS